MNQTNIGETYRNFGYLVRIWDRCKELLKTQGLSYELGVGMVQFLKKTKPFVFWDEPNRIYGLVNRFIPYELNRTEPKLIFWTELRFFGPFGNLIMFFWCFLNQNTMTLNWSISSHWEIQTRTRQGLLLDECYDIEFDVRDKYNTFFSQLFAHSLEEYMKFFFVCLTSWYILYTIHSGNFDDNLV